MERVGLKGFGPLAGIEVTARLNTTFSKAHQLVNIMFDATSVVLLLVALLISTIIIYVVTKLMGETEGIGRALLAAVIGTVIYALAYWLLSGSGILAAIVGGIFWLLALKALYKIGWVKALVIAVLIWILASIIGVFLPTSNGPF